MGFTIPRSRLTPLVGLTLAEALAVASDPSRVVFSATVRDGGIDLYVLG